LWHGANWTFIIWGALNGFYLVFAILTDTWRKRFNQIIHLDTLPRLQRTLQILITFGLSCIAWVFFRADSIDEAFKIILKIFTFNGPFFVGELHHLLYGLFAIAFLLVIEFGREYHSQSSLPFKTNHWLKEKLLYTLLILLILLIGVFDGGQFIYFQF
jgi:D-alanyl-lipoteichoic acid acyltransferase DltB (MBOAT superfamily)